MNTCPCCSDQLIRHVRHSRVYWFCTTCWQEMPDLAEVISKSLPAKSAPLSDWEAA